MAGLVDALFARSGISLGVRPPKLSTKKNIDKKFKGCQLSKKNMLKLKKKNEYPF
jgi:hypothetical protein